MSDIFSPKEVKQTPVETPLPSIPSPSLYEDLLKDIVNESGQPKYQSVDVALQALKASQEYIPQLRQKESALEAEVRQLREELAKRSSVEEVVERLKQAQAPTAPQITTVPSGLDENAVLGILAKRDAETVALANIKSVSDRLTAKYGDKAKEVLQQKITELGISAQSLKELSAQSPAAVFALFGGSGVKPTSPVSSSYNLPLEKKEGVLERPTKSLLVGASDKERIEYMRKIKADVYAKYGITE